MDLKTILELKADYFNTADCTIWKVQNYINTIKMGFPVLIGGIEVIDPIDSTRVGVIENSTIVNQLHLKDEDALYEFIKNL